MKHEDKTKELLIDELKAMHLRISELEELVVERKRTEESLRESEEKYRLLAENITDVIWTVDLNLRPSYISPSVKNFRGYSVEEAMVQDIEEWLTPASYEIAIKALQEELAIADMERGEFSGIQTVVLEHTCKDGSTIWAESKITFLRDSDGRTIGILGVTRDIVERRRAEENLKNSEERLKILFEFAPDAYYLNDMEGNFGDGNKAAEELIGYKREELIGKNFLELEILPQEQISMAAEGLLKNSQGFATGPDEYILNRKDGGQVQVEIRTFPVKIAGETLALGIARDIAERKQAEEELKRRNEQLEKVSKLTMGREKRMIELKKEVNALLQELGREKRYDW